MICSSRRTVYAVWLYADGASWRNLRIPGSRQPADVRGGADRGNTGLYGTAGRAEEKCGMTMKSACKK